MKTATIITALLLAGCASTQPHPQTRPGNDCQARLDDAARATELTLILLPGCEKNPNHERRECKALVNAIKANNANQVYENAAACLRAGQYGNLTAGVARHRRDSADQVVERIGALVKRLY